MRSQVAYDVERLTGLPVETVEVVVEDVRITDEGARARGWRAARWRRSRRARARIDDLNVYPVPDGDTGTNLALTVRAIVEALEGEGPDDRAGLAHEVSRAALMGARGNSGVILSQIVRGAAESLAGSDDLALALRSASDAAYRAVRKPVEGTMLTAIRELAEEAEAGGDLAAVIARGEDCVARTRELLPVLAEAGVVDAGAAGLVEILRGVAAVLEGVPLPSRAAVLSAAPTRRVDPPSSSPSSSTARRSWSRASGSTPERARAGARAARRLAPRRRRLRRRSRCTSTPTTPAGRCRSGSRTARSPASRSRTCTRRRSSASGGCCTRCRQPLGPVRRRRGGGGRREPAGCSRTSALTSSTAAAR